MKPDYKLRKDEHGNYLFLDYTTKYGKEYALYDCRWIWVKERGDWFLVPFPQHHSKALPLLEEEIKLAKRAWEEISGGKKVDVIVVRKKKKPAIKLKACPMCKEPIRFMGVEDGEEILKCKCGLCDERKPEVNN